MTRLCLLISCFLIGAALTGCSSVENLFGGDDGPALEGERISVLELQKSLEPDNLPDGTPALSLPTPWRNQFWPQAGGYPNHSMQNLALNTGKLKTLWRANIGEGASTALPLTARPIAVNGRVYTLDTESRLSAFNMADGKPAWQRNIADREEDDIVIGGGLAFGDGLILATNGYNEVIALDPETGAYVWRQRVGSPVRAAPTIIDGRAFVTTLDNKLLALETSNGRILWEYSGISESAGLIGMASPAANRDIVLPAFSSGEITALRVENGSVAWSDNLASFRRFGGLGSISDIRAHPILDQGLAIALSFSGKLVAIDERTGSRVWQRDIGGVNTPWIAGDTIFVLTNDYQLVALSRTNGAVFWVSELPRFEDPDDRDEPIIWHGPVMGNGRLFLAGSHGTIIEFNAKTGEQANQTEAADSFSIPPIIAGETLYLLSDDGTLSAYR